MLFDVEMVVSSDAQEIQASNERDCIAEFVASQAIVLLDAEHRCGVGQDL